MAWKDVVSVSEKRSVFYSEMDSFIGPITLVGTNQGVCMLQYGSAEHSLPLVKTWLKKKNLKVDLLQQNNEALQTVVTQLEEYFSGERNTFDVEIDLYGTKFQRLVWEALNAIPYGQTKSYKQVALEIGAPKAVRAIGAANNQNPLPIILPCHRVVGSNGAMVGYGGGLRKKEQLLVLEGALQKVSS
ncbi:methylated-DNA--[protein]-cysteine S-methyltransferase [Thalassorhabdus alkalitolerans]|uniref:Methylated-DNA--protein-cysteine methyltransferase n=1 Tax=Thalassorhabdus alkalitolerans TaxID=2282697 RepID=A0ABW0YNL0_9BACI|nr:MULTISPECIES: methylated-DNA--[protein]-cysteine S-methyltransferase [Bacillaceae]